MKEGRGNQLRWVVWTISLILCLSAARTILDLLKREDIVKNRETQLRQLREQNKALKKSLADMGNDHFVEQVARNQLGLVREGETLLILPDQTASGSAVGSGDSGPVWKRWYRLFF